VTTATETKKITKKKAPVATKKPVVKKATPATIPLEGCRRTRFVGSGDDERLLILPDWLTPQQALQQPQQQVIRLLPLQEPIRWLEPLLESLVTLRQQVLMQPEPTQQQGAGSEAGTR
jgi:hypothetical protein